MQEKISLTLILIFTPLLPLCTAVADTLTLKSGRVIECDIVKRTNAYTKIKYERSEICYENKYIKNVETAKFPVIEKAEGQAGEGSPAYSSIRKALELASGGNFEEASRMLEKELADMEGCLATLERVKNGSIGRQYAVFLFKGLSHMLDGDYGQARSSLEKAWEIDPGDPDLNFNLGLISYSMGEFDKAAIYLYPVLKAHPDDIDAYELISKAYYGAGNIQKAKEYLLIAKQLLAKSNDAAGIKKINSLSALMSEN